MRAPLVVVALCASSCSFITATGFEECASDSECGPASACVRRYCLPLPAACSRTEGAFDAGDRIPLGALVPLTADGTVSERELIRLEAMQLALREANSKGGLGHRQFALFTCNVLDTDEAVKAKTEWLIANLEVAALFSSGSSRTRWMAVDDVRVDAGTFIMSANSTSTSLISLHQTYGNVWRVAPPDTQQARVIRSLVSESVDAGAAVSIIYEKSDYGDGLELYLQDELTRAGFPVALVDYQPPLDAARATTAAGRLGVGPGATVMVGFPGDVALLATAAATVHGLTPGAGHRWFLSDAAKDPAILTAATKPLLEGAVGTAPAQSKGLAFLNFRDSFQNTFGADPTAYSFTAHSYDAMWLTLAATAWASREGGAVTGPRMGEGMSHLASGPSEQLLGANWLDLSLKLSGGTSVDVEGSSGPLVFDVEAGAPASQYEVWTVTDGGIGTKTFRSP